MGKKLTCVKKLKYFFWLFHVVVSSRTRSFFQTWSGTWFRLQLGLQHLFLSSVHFAWCSKVWNRRQIRALSQSQSLETVPGITVWKKPFRRNSVNRASWFVPNVSTSDRVSRWWLAHSLVNHENRPIYIFFFFSHHFWRDNYFKDLSSMQNFKFHMLKQADQTDVFLFLKEYQRYINPIQIAVLKSWKYICKKHVQNLLLVSNFATSKC